MSYCTCDLKSAVLLFLFWNIVSNIYKLWQSFGQYSVINVVHLLVFNNIFSISQSVLWHSSLNTLELTNYLPDIVFIYLSDIVESRFKEINKHRVFLKYSTVPPFLKPHAIIRTPWTFFQSLSVTNQDILSQQNTTKN